MNFKRIQVKKSKIFGLIIQSFDFQGQNLFT
jgi:hypothetical protein